MLIVQGNAELSVLRPASPPHAGHSALACLDGTLSARFHTWQGGSGRRYITSVFPLDHAAPGANLPDLGEAVLIAVGQHGDDRSLLGVVAVERASDWARAILQFHDRSPSKPDEWHVHLLARDRAARAAVVSDLDRRQRRAVVA